MNDEEFSPQETEGQVNQAIIDQAEAEAQAAHEAAQNPPDERVDWKARAIEAQTRLEMLQNQAQQQQYEPEQDPIQSIQQQIEEKRQNMPELDQSNPQSFWDRERVKEEIADLRERLVQEQLNRQQAQVMEQQVGATVKSYKAEHQDNPYFRAVERQFDQAVQQLQPHLRGNPAMLDMVRRNLEHQELMKERQGKKTPPQAPSGAYNPQAEGQRQQQGQAKWKSDADRRVGEYYMERGIISGPEEFYDDKFNKHSPSANNNGVAIYDVPTVKRGWRR